MLNMIRVFWYFFFIFWCAFIPKAHADFYTQMAYSPQWLKLLHYHQDTIQNYVGLVENAEFYLDKKAGQYNPQSELMATIEAFNNPNNKAKCMFPARFNLLKERGFVAGDLQDCDKYRQFMEDVKPDGITLLFTNAYMNNPASLFGHTLIRIDTKRKGTQMLAHGSNFGANSGTEYGFLFAFKGLFGGYDGVYSIMPYWEIINTYNNIENRDIWEYKLNLSQEEQIKFVNHLYEMHIAKIRYYFLRKNCSYMILELLEAVKPELNITKEYKAWVIPLDTLKTVKNIPNLISQINYRPARLTKIKSHLKEMNKKQYTAFVRAVIKNEFENQDLSQQEYVDVLETAYQYFQYQYIEQKTDLAQYRKNSFAVLRRRSNFAKTDFETKLKGENPYLSHDSMQISLSYGSYNKNTYEQIGIRPAYTALTDSSYGLVKGAQTEVLKSVWRNYNQTHKFVLQEFTPLKIKSLVPADKIFSPLSYQTDVSLRKELNPANQKEGYVFNLSIGAGKTYNFFDWFWGYALADLKGQYSGLIERNHWIGVAPQIGIYKDFERLRLHAYVDKTFADSDFGERLQYTVETAYDLTKNISIKGAYFLSCNHGKNQKDLSLSLQYNF